jgi:hypothetical protein
LIITVVACILVVGYCLGMLALIWLGGAPFGLNLTGELWGITAFVLAAVLAIVPLQRRVRIALTAVTLALLGIMALLVLRGDAPLGVTELWGLLPIAVMAVAAVGFRPRARRSQQRHR